MYACMMLEYAIGFDLYEFPVLMRMRSKFNPQQLFDGLSMRGIGVNSETANHWDKTQITLKCCGLDGYTDWTKIEHDVVPDSCCRIYKPDCGRNFSPENIYHRGCEGKLTKHTKHQYIIQTQPQQIFYLLVSVVFFASANLIMFFSVMACMRNKENSYILVSDDQDVKKRVMFNADAGDKFVIEIDISRKSFQ